MYSKDCVWVGQQFTNRETNSFIFRAKVYCKKKKLKKCAQKGNGEKIYSKTQHAMILNSLEN